MVNAKQNVQKCKTNVLEKPIFLTEMEAENYSLSWIFQ
jgi:hypothetical protein